ncbi:30S ribosome-binding factor RbfA [Tautonia rosea]|uniref:30S ribosome-binding factor RbfA n=1 Tax=Tautonia rosea TaxID=2728037 RepID=UPI00147643AE|nr:30S ribosome-binding factor RbfA [Tautonia rosea]
MSSHRIERLNEAVREVVSSAVLFEVADPRVKGVTVLEAEVASDLKHATVFVSVMGDETAQRLALRGLQSAAGFLQSRLAARLKTRYTPILRFELDQGVKNSVAMSRLIDETLAADRLARGERPEDADLDHANQTHHDACSDPDQPATD